MKVIVPIGGGEIPFTTNKIDEYVVSLAKVEKVVNPPQKPVVSRRHSICEVVL